MNAYYFEGNTFPEALITPEDLSTKLRLQAKDINVEKDSDFLNKASYHNLIIIKLGHLALQKTGNEDVRKLAQMLIEDHTISFDNLVELAEKKEVSIYNYSCRNLQQCYMDLSNLSDGEFDRMYCRVMSETIKKAITIFEKTSNKSKDQDIVLWSCLTLAILNCQQMHIEHSYNKVVA